jgi:multicomponent Na+:H+ antiporter subunit B
MKKVLAFFLSIGLGVMIIMALNANESFTEFGLVDISERISFDFINRSTDGVQEDVVFGETQVTEGGPANMVTAIVADYRSFDTLGEVTVLFVSSLGVALLLGGAKAKRLELNFKPNFMLKVGSKALFGIILMTGVYVIVHGHLTPGGGFPGGAMIASSILLLYLADDSFRTKVKGFKVLESFAGVAYVAIGIAGLFVADYFLVNFLDNGIVGNLFSAGIIPIIYVLIGLKVGSEISGVIDHFLTEQEGAL